MESTDTFNSGIGATGRSHHPLNYVNCSAVQADGKILIGGDFDSVAGQPRHGIARLNEDGSVESTATFNVGAGTNGGSDGPSVRRIALQPDGKILIAGDFSIVDGQPRGNIARLNSDGTVESESTFNVGTGVESNGLFSMAVQPDGRILVAVGSIGQMDIGEIRSAGLTQMAA